jgi:hypothetical protein
MFDRVPAAPLQTDVFDQVLLVVLQGLVTVAFLGIGVVVAHLLVRALRTEYGRLRDREARFVLVGAGVLFVVGFARLVVVVEGAQGSLAAIVLGFTAVTYLLYLGRPTLFETPGQDQRNETVDERTTR